MCARPRLPAKIPNDISARLGKRVYELRLKTGMTQSELAGLFGIDRSFLSDMECGKRSCSVPMAEVLAAGFEITLSELFKGL